MEQQTWRDSLRLYADWPLRLAFASVFLYHGINKLTGDMGGFAEMMDISEPVAWFVALSEVLAGTLVLIGGLNGNLSPQFTRIGGALVVPLMIGAVAKYHWPQWRFFVGGGENLAMGGMQFQILMAGLGIFFLLTAAHFNGRSVEVANGS